MLANPIKNLREQMHTLPILASGQNPKNLEDFSTKLHILVTLANGEWLLDPRFNKPTTKGGAKSLIQKLNERQGVAKEVKKEEKVKREEGVDDDNEYEDDQPTRPVVLSWSALVLFADPFNDDGHAEPDTMKQTRVLIWSAIVRALPNHRHLVKGSIQGDVFGLVTKIRGLSQGRDESVQVSNLHALSGFTAKGKKWGDISLAMTKLLSSIQEVTSKNKALTIGEGLIVEVLLRAMDDVSDFKTTVQLIRTSKAISYDSVMCALNDRANSIATAAYTEDIQANVGEARDWKTVRRPRGDKGNGPNWGSDNVCNYYRKGVPCPFSRNGKKCRFKHSGPQDMPNDRCPSCGEAGHGLQDCKKALRAKVAESDDGSQDDTLEASVATVDDPTGMWPSKASLDM